MYKFISSCLGVSLWMVMASTVTQKSEHSSNLWKTAKLSFSSLFCQRRFEHISHCNALPNPVMDSTTMLQGRDFWSTNHPYCKGGFRWTGAESSLKIQPQRQCFQDMYAKRSLGTSRKGKISVPSMGCQERMAPEPVTVGCTPKEASQCTAGLLLVAF